VEFEVFRESRCNGGDFYKESSVFVSVKVVPQYVSGVAFDGVVCQSGRPDQRQLKRFVVGTQGWSSFTTPT